MVADALVLLKTVFENCVLWFGQLFAAVDGQGVLIAAFIVMLTVTLFLMPLRGGGITVGGFQDFVTQATYKPKHWNGKRKLYGGMQGKFSKKAVGGHRAHERY